MQNKAVLSGGCLCGSIRYKVSGERIFSIVCHCRMCQRASGAPFIAIFFVATASIKLEHGQPLTYPSSPQVLRHFCGGCGSPLFFDRLSRPEMRAVFVGSLDDSNEFVPEMQVCMSSSVGWLPTLESVPKYAEKPEGMTPTFAYNVVTGEAITGSTSGA